VELGIEGVHEVMEINCQIKKRDPLPTNGPWNRQARRLLFNLRTAAHLEKLSQLETLRQLEKVRQRATLGPERSRLQVSLSHSSW